MKRTTFMILLLFTVFSVHSQNLAQAVLQCDFPTVQKYVEKLDVDLNKRLDNQYIGYVNDPTYLFLAVYDENSGNGLERCKMAKYLIEHSAKIDADSLFWVIELQRYELLWYFYVYGKFDKNIRLTLGSLDAVYSPMNSLTNAFSSFSKNYNEEKKKLAQKKWTLLDYYQSSLLHKWNSNFTYNAERDFYAGVYTNNHWLWRNPTNAFYTMELLARISNTEDYEKCNHTVWLIAEDLEHIKKYLREGGEFYEVDFMVMNLLRNEELISFLKDLDFYKPCNIKTEELGPFAFWILDNFFKNKIDKNSIEYLKALYYQHFDSSGEYAKKILELEASGIKLNKSLDNFSELTLSDFKMNYEILD
ncbi:MAG: hypothetical protein J5527_13845 [Treponema sp.]|nr:hypothetical protein [Treponema sp.]